MELRMRIVATVAALVASSVAATANAEEVRISCHPKEAITEILGSISFSAAMSGERDTRLDLLNQDFNLILNLSGPTLELEGVPFEHVRIEEGTVFASGVHDKQLISFSLRSDDGEFWYARHPIDCKVDSDCWTLAKTGFVVRSGDCRRPILD